jgi:hypothetical protein
MAIHTYAPVGKTPILRVKLTRDHLSAMGGITPEGRIFMQTQDHSYKGPDVVRFLQLLTRELPGAHSSLSGRQRLPGTRRCQADSS